MNTKLPEYLVELIQAYPLLKEESTRRVLAGDLQQGARWYAQRAADNGKQGQWWKVWRELQGLLGRSLEEALDELSSQQRFWLARWAFAHLERAEAMLAYRSYLAKPGPTGPLMDKHTTLYLEALWEAEGPSSVLELADALAARSDLPVMHIFAARAAFELGDTDAALVRLAVVRDRYLDDGDLWAATAELYARHEDPDAARAALQECARLGISDPGLEQEVLGALHLTREEWQALRGPFEITWPSYDEELTAWRADPGARLRPWPEPSLHWVGGSEFDMPACPGCDHPIRQWFVLDIRDIAPLRERLPSWTLFPLLGCSDCLAWTDRHDYEVNPDTLEVRLVNVAGIIQRDEDATPVVADLPKQYARLEWMKPVRQWQGTDADPSGFPDWDRPQIGGHMVRVQDPVRAFCRRCRAEMVFVAAMATTRDFGPEIWINNGSGYQYHLACDACHTISVIAQWT